MGAALGSLAFTAGIAALLYAGVASLSAALRAELGADRGDVIAVHPGSAQPSCRLGERECITSADASAAAMTELRRVQEPAAPRGSSATVSRTVVSVRSRGRTARAEVIGTHAALFGLQSLTVRAGRVWTPGEETAGKPIALVGRLLFDSLVPWRSAAGASKPSAGVVTPPPLTIRIGRTDLDVIGVVESGAVSSEQVDRAVLVSRALFSRLHLWGTAPPTLYARAPTDGAAGTSGLLDALRVLERRIPRYAGQLVVRTTADELGELSLLEESLARGVLGLSVVLTLSALVAVAALMVTIARSHRRTVGIARAMGATRGVVAAQGALIGVMVAGAGVVCGGLLAAVGMSLLTRIADLPAVTLADAFAAFARGAGPPMLASVVTGTVTFARLAWLRPARLLG